MLNKKFPGQFIYHIFKDKPALNTGNFEWTLIKDKKENNVVHSRKESGLFIQDDLDGFFAKIEKLT